MTVPFNNCIKCHKELEYCKHYNATIYYIKGPKLSTIKVKKCSECNILYDLDKFIDANEKFFYSKKINYEFFMTSSETGFSKKIFQQCNEYLIRNGFSFSAFSDSYNELFAKTAVRPTAVVYNDSGWSNVGFKQKYYILRISYLIITSLILIVNKLKLV